MGGNTSNSGTTTELEDPYFYDYGAEKWTRKRAKGDPPPGRYWGACCCSGNSIYLYGGQNVLEADQGSLYEFNTEMLSWKKLEEHSTPGAPMKKRCCGMVDYNGNLIIFGGYTDSPGNIQTGSECVRGRTNELHMYKFSEGKSNFSYSLS